MQWSRELGVSVKRHKAAAYVAAIAGGCVAVCGLVNLDTGGFAGWDLLKALATPFFVVAAWKIAEPFHSPIEEHKRIKKVLQMLAISKNANIVVAGLPVEKGGTENPEGERFAPGAGEADALGVVKSAIGVFGSHYGVKTVYSYEIMENSQTAEEVQFRKNFIEECETSTVFLLGGPVYNGATRWVLEITRRVDLPRLVRDSDGKYSGAIELGGRPLASKYPARTGPDVDPSKRKRDCGLVIHLQNAELEGVKFRSLFVLSGGGTAGVWMAARGVFDGRHLWDKIDEKEWSGCETKDACGWWAVVEGEHCTDFDLVPGSLKIVEWEPIKKIQIDPLKDAATPHGN